MAKHIKITIETDSLMVLRGRKALRAWCPPCRAESEMIPLDGIGVISNLTPPEFEAWIQSEDLHHVPSADGGALICLNSLLKRVNKQSLRGRLNKCEKEGI